MFGLYLSDDVGTKGSSDLKVNTSETQKACYDCKLDFVAGKTATVHPVPLWDSPLAMNAAPSEIVWVCEDCKTKRLAEYDEKHRCHACKGPSSKASPYLWVFDPRSVNAYHSSQPIWLVTRCCGNQAHTEYVATVCTYLHDWKKNATAICDLMNKQLLGNEPEPEWLVKWKRELPERLAEAPNDPSASLRRSLRGA